MRTPRGARSPRRTSLLHRLREALSLQRGRVESILADPGETAVHDLRVALRRTTALAKLGRGLPGEGYGNPLRKAARRLRGLLSSRRSQEVFAALLVSRFEHDPVRKRTALAAVRKIGGTPGPSFSGPGFKRSVRDVRKCFDGRDAELASVLASGLDESRVEALLRRRVARRLKKLGRALITAGVPSRESLHGFRIAAKELRYTLEFLGESTPSSAPLLRELRRFQELAGDAHDRIELTTAIRSLAVAEGASSPSRALLGPLEADVRRAVRVSVDSAARLLSRLRAAPLPIPSSSRKGALDKKCAP